MIEAKYFVELLSQNGVENAYGVPDSLLKDFCLQLEESSSPIKNQICVNEGNAIAMAMGYHLSTKKTAAIYLQNSYRCRRKFLLAGNSGRCQQCNISLLLFSRC